MAKKICYFCGSEKADDVAGMRLEIGISAKRHNGKEEILSLDMSKVALKSEGKVVPCCPNCIQLLLFNAFKNVFDKSE